jgi:hypothetical protein
VRHPRAHEVEHVAREVQLLVEVTDRGDGVVVDVGDEPGRRVEDRVVAVVRAVEETRREAW